jgi:CxxC-x17-CxxC domain-containing protein
VAMYDVSHLGLKCAQCGADIKELPFMPSQDRPVYCSQCARERKPRFGAGAGRRGGGYSRRGR